MIKDLKFRLDSLSLTNFRGFQKLEHIEFHPQLTIFIGVNGSGKTAILEAVAGMLKVLEQVLRSKPIDNQSIFQETDINNSQKADILRNQLKVTASWVETDGLNDDLNNSQPLSWYVDKVKENFQELSTLEEAENIKDAFLEAENITLLNVLVTNINLALQTKNTNNKSINLPILAYYPNARAFFSFTNSDKDKPSKRLSIFNGYDKALDGNAFSFQDFFNWYKRQEGIESQNIALKVRRDERIYKNYVPNPILKATREAIYQIMSDEHEYRDLRIDLSDENYPDGKMLITKNDVEVMVSQLSSGEKTLLALVADIARRLCILNEERVTTFEEKVPMKNVGVDADMAYVEEPATQYGLQRNSPLDGYGIVLIDELDLHLHPRWQRAVLPKLMTIFPNVQWVVTTHSPQILGEVKNANIHIIEDRQVRLLDFNTYGKDMNRILERIMGIPERNEDILESLNKYFILIEQNKLEDARNIRNELEALIGTDEPLFLKADGIIRRKQLIGR